VELVSNVMTKAKYNKTSFVEVSESEALAMLDAGEVTLLLGYQLDEKLIAHVETKASDESALIDEVDTAKAADAEEEVALTSETARYIASCAYISGKNKETLVSGGEVDLGNRDYVLIGLPKAAKIISAFDTTFERVDINGEIDDLWKQYFEVGALFGVVSAVRRWALGVWRQFRINLIEENRYQMIFTGLGRTLVIAVCAAVLGVLLGCIVALMRLSKMKLMNVISSVYVDIIRGTPVVVQLMIMYYVILTSPDISKVTVAIITFGFNSGAYVSEMVRGGILAIDKGQTEAGRSLGLSASATMMLIILPQTIKIIIPSLFNEIIALLKETSIVGFIGLMDLTKAGDFIRSRTYSAFFPLLAVAAVYLILVTVLTRLFNMLERRLRQSDIR